MKNIYKFIFLFISFLILLLQISCKTSSDNLPLNPTLTPEKTVALQGTTLTLASVPFRNELKFIQGWEELTDYLSKEIGRPVKFEVKKSYKEIIEGLKNEDIDIAHIGALAYVKVYEEIKITPLVRSITLINKEPFYKSCIIVRKDSGIKNITQLKGKKFAFTDRNSTSGYLIPLSMFAEAGIKDLTFFSKYMFTEDHRSAFLAVYNGYVDGAAFANYSFLEGTDERLKDIAIIKESAPIPTGPIVIRSSIGKETADKIKKALLKIGTTKDTMEIAKLLEATGYVEALDENYDPIRKARKNLENMKMELNME